MPEAFEFPALRVMVAGSFEPTFHQSESRRPRGVHASVRGSLKRGFHSGSTCLRRFIDLPTGQSGGPSPWLPTSTCLFAGSPRVTDILILGRVAVVAGGAAFRRRGRQPKANRPQNDRPRGGARPPPHPGRRARRRKQEKRDAARGQGKGPRNRNPGREAGPA